MDMRNEIDRELNAKARGKMQDKGNFGEAYSKHWKHVHVGLYYL